MQPAEPMGVSSNSLEDNQIPEHIPIQMALAPEQHPYDHPHVIRSQSEEEENNEEGKNRHKLSSHSLSPEQLGVTGYVKDVAGFVKDAYQSAHDRKAAHRISGQKQTASHEHEHEQEHPTTISEVSAAVAASPQARESSPLAEAVTGLFPGLDHNAHGCSHADELRHDLMRQHSREESTADPAHPMLPSK